MLDLQTGRQQRFNMHICFYCNKST